MSCRTRRLALQLAASRRTFVELAILADLAVVGATAVLCTRRVTASRAEVFASRVAQVDTAKRGAFVQTAARAGFRVSSTASLGPFFFTALASEDRHGSSVCRRTGCGSGVRAAGARISCRFATGERKQRCGEQQQ